MENRKNSKEATMKFDTCLEKRIYNFDRIMNKIIFIGLSIFVLFVFGQLIRFFLR